MSYSFFLRYSYTVSPEIKIFNFFFSRGAFFAVSKKDPCFGLQFKMLVQIHLGEMVS